MTLCLKKGLLQDYRRARYRSSYGIPVCLSQIFTGYETAWAPESSTYSNTERKRERNLLSKPVFQHIPSKFTLQFTGYIIFAIS